MNTVCCKKLLSKEDIIQNHSHRAITFQFNQTRDDDVYSDKSTLKTVPFVVHTSDGKNLPPHVQSNQQNIREQKPKIHHLSTLPTRDKILCIATTTYCHPRQWLLWIHPWGIQNHQILENLWTVHITFIESVMLDFRPTCCFNHRVLSLRRRMRALFNTRSIICTRTRMIRRSKSFLDWED